MVYCPLQECSILAYFANLQVKPCHLLYLSYCFGCFVVVAVAVLDHWQVAPCCLARTAPY